jgi:hypothetical protein
MLRFVEFGRFRAENRPKSMVKIWKRTKNVVPLHYRKLRARADVEKRANDCSGSKFFTFHSSLFTLICGIRPPDVAGRK